MNKIVADYKEKAEWCKLRVEYYQKLADTFENLICIIEEDAEMKLERMNPTQAAISDE